MSSVRRSMKRKILFLLTEDPETVEAARSFHQIEMLYDVLRSRGAIVDFRCWRDPNLSPVAVIGYNAVTFLSCDGYHYYPQDFQVFAADVLTPAQRLDASINIVNNLEVVLWNMDKHYLKELADEGFPIPRTLFVDICNRTKAALTSAIVSFAGTHSVVLKPTMSGSSKMTYLIRNARSLTANDADFVELALSKSRSGDMSGLILQEYMEEICQGEYSLVFINGRITHAMLKTPQAGEFRCQTGFGGATKHVRLGDVPAKAIEASQEIIFFLESKFEGDSEERMAMNSGSLVYVRVDGIMKEGAFVLMEVEAIEPQLWLDSKYGAEGLEQLCQTLLR